MAEKLVLYAESWTITAPAPIKDDRFRVLVLPADGVSVAAASYTEALRKACKSLVDQDKVFIEHQTLDCASKILDMFHEPSWDMIQFYGPDIDLAIPRQVRSLAALGMSTLGGLPPVEPQTLAQAFHLQVANRVQHVFFTCRRGHEAAKAIVDDDEGPSGRHLIALDPAAPAASVSEASIVQFTADYIHHALASLRVRPPFLYAMT